MHLRTLLATRLGRASLAAAAGVIVLVVLDLVVWRGIDEPSAPVAMVRNLSGPLLVATLSLQFAARGLLDRRWAAVAAIAMFAALIVAGSGVAVDLRLPVADALLDVAGWALLVGAGAVLAGWATSLRERRS
jgi:hypothetical protein